MADELTRAQRIGLAIRKARQDKGWSLRDLDLAANVSKNYIWRLEHPGTGTRRVGAKVLGALADALDLSIDDLYRK
jgi:transcriptional regulator with XRE-family HTH domain